MKLLGSLTIISSMLLSGCSVYMASTLPIARPPSNLQPSRSMRYVDRHFGYPIAMGEDEQGNHVEQLQFIDGVPIGWKVARFSMHGMLDTITYGLWEFVGTPIELMNRNYPIYVYYVIYDDNDEVARVVSADSTEGRRLSELAWTLPFIDDLKVNMQDNLRVEYKGSK